MDYDNTTIASTYDAARGDPVVQEVRYFVFGD